MKKIKIGNSKTIKEAEILWEKSKTETREIIKWKWVGFPYEVGLKYYIVIIKEQQTNLFDEML